MRACAHDRPENMHQKISSPSSAQAATSAASSVGVDFVRFLFFGCSADGVGFLFFLDGLLAFVPLFGFLPLPAFLPFGFGDGFEPFLGPALDLAAGGLVLLTEGFFFSLLLHA